jgi:nitroimidazol reductase NimA-like FMN-containing flavoprotein (pyridoxamine 5'-phosphate oxidase superfamily)
MIMRVFDKTEKNQVKRVPERAAYEEEVIYKIVDEAIICHVGMVQDGQPFVIPTLHARRGDTILLHGASTSRLIRYAATGAELCITMTLLDGLVLARSAYSHSANYRSVVLFGRGTIIDRPEEKLQALEQLTEGIMPGRWADVRQPSEKELKATTIVAIAINLATAKTRQGPPGDEEPDYQLDVWAGVLPVRQQIGRPIADPKLKEGIEVPDNVNRYVLNQGR